MPSLHLVRVRCSSVCCCVLLAYISRCGALLQLTLTCSAAFRDKSHELFSGSHDRTVRVWNLDQMAFVEQLFGHQADITGIDRCVARVSLCQGFLTTLLLPVTRCQSDQGARADFRCRQDHPLVESPRGIAAAISRAQVIY